MESKDLHSALKRYFGHNRFICRQEEIVRRVLQKKNVLVIMPTGAGKSILYQLPALLLPGLTVVVSPLIALMKDQVDHLTSQGIAAVYINSLLKKDEREKRYAELSEGRYSILYVTPERFRKPDFVGIIEKREISLLAIDEAHCISQWGHDFRPDYTRLRQFRKVLGNPPVIALTATATPAVQQDIIRQLGIEAEDMQLFHQGTERPNLDLQVSHLYGEDNKLKQIQKVLQKNPGPGIIYFTLIKDLLSMSRRLSGCGISHLVYHGELTAGERIRIQNRFMKEKSGLVLATNAFGMGIDRPDIRFIIHAQVPGSLEAYYQEIGRAGRDGKPALCLLLYDKYDLSIHLDFIRWNNPGAELYRRAFDFLTNEEKKINLEGMDYFREQLTFRYGKDFRVDTVLALFDRWGVTEGSLQNKNLHITAPLPEFLASQEFLERKLKTEHEKLYRMMLYTRECTNRSAYLNDYFRNFKELSVPHRELLRD